MAEVVSRNPKDRFVFCDELLLDHVERDVDGGETGALAVAGLQHPELSFLDGELDVLHVAEVLLERCADLEELLVATSAGPSPSA